MTQQIRIPVLQKCVTDKDITKQLKLRKKDFQYQSINKKAKSIIKEKEEEGWEIDREFKTTIKLRKEKSHDFLFEDKVWCLFASLGFSVLNKDRHLYLPYDTKNPNLTQQIDVFAKDEETLIIVECKSTKAKNKPGNFKKELEAYKSKMKGLIKSLKLIFPDENLKFKFILATENYSISDNDKERLKQINGIHFNEAQIDYFTKMYHEIGAAAKYQLLGNLFKGQEIPEMDNKIPAIQGKMGGHTYYSFSIEPEKLLKISYVLHRNKANINMMPTYQRIIKKARLKSINHFIDNENGYFPNSIIISLDSGKKNQLNFDSANTQSKSSISKIGILHLPKRYRSAFIIDGQHRLYGYANSKYKNTNSIPVVAFLNLDRSEQIKLFMQINENQKAVSKNLRGTLNADLLWTSDSHTEKLRALCSRVAISLGENRRSALFDKISTGEDKKLITLQAFESALKKTNFFGKVTKRKIIKLGTFYHGDLDDCFEKLNNFILRTFNHIKDSIPEIWETEGNIVVINKGVYAIIRLQSDIVDFLLLKAKVKNTKNTLNLFNESKNYLNPIINFFKSADNETKMSLRKAYGGNGNIKYWRTLQQKVKDVFQEFNPEGLEEYNKKEAKEYNTRTLTLTQELNSFLKKDIQEKLEDKLGSKWFKDGLPLRIAKKYIELAYDKNYKLSDDDEEYEPWDLTTITDYRAIVLENWRNIFQKHYTTPKETKIKGDKNAKTQWMDKLKKLTNKDFNQYSVTEDEFYFLNELHDWLIGKSPN